MKKILLAAVLMTGFSVVSRAGVDDRNETGSVQGTIFDAETKKPVAKVTSRSAMFL